jgi:hypothetical protein
MPWTYYDCCWEIACAYAVYERVATTLRRYRYYCAITHGPLTPLRGPCGPQKEERRQKPAQTRTPPH